MGSRFVGPLALVCLTTVATSYGDDAGTWAAILPEQSVACLSTAVPADALATAVGDLTSAASSAGLSIGSMVVFGAGEAAAQPCVQIGAQALAPGAHGLIARALSPRAAALRVCPVAEAETCASRLSEQLGSTWRGQIFSAAIYRWVEPATRGPVDSPPSREALVRLASGEPPAFTPPDRQSELAHTDVLFVGMAPDGVALADVEALLVPPPAPGDTPEVAKPAAPTQ